MLVTPRTYQLSQAPDKGSSPAGSGKFVSTNSAEAAGWWESSRDLRHVERMLLVHQTGSVRVGEVVR